MLCRRFQRERYLLSHPASAGSRSSFRSFPSGWPVVNPSAYILNTRHLWILSSAEQSIGVRIQEFPVSDKPPLCQLSAKLQRLARTRASGIRRRRSKQSVWAYKTFINLLGRATDLSCTMANSIRLFSAVHRTSDDSLGCPQLT